MSRLVLGTVQFGLPYGISNQAGQVTRSVAEDMLQNAAAHGIEMIDTAIAYGDSETCLGELGTKGFKLITKLPAFPDDCEDICAWVSLQLAESLTRLRVNGVYGLLLHRPEQLLGRHGDILYQALQELKDVGYVKKIGVSINASSELDALTSKYVFDLVQAPFNLVDRRLHSSGWLKRLKQKGVEIHTRSAFLQGLLLMPPASIPSQFASWNELWRRWLQWLETHDISAVKACIAYPLSFTEIDRVVVGAVSSSQLVQIISAENTAFPCDFPDLMCEEENLINPLNWLKL